MLVLEREDAYDLMRADFDIVEGVLTHPTRLVRRLYDAAGVGPRNT